MVSSSWRPTGWAKHGKHWLPFEGRTDWKESDFLAHTGADRLRLLRRLLWPWSVVGDGLVDCPIEPHPVGVSAIKVAHHGVPRRIGEHPLSAEWNQLWPLADLVMFAFSWEKMLIWLDGKSMYLVDARAAWAACSEKQQLQSWPQVALLSVTFVLICFSKHRYQWV